MRSIVQTENIAHLPLCSNKPTLMTSAFAETDDLVRLYRDIQTEISRLSRFQIERSLREVDQHAEAVSEALDLCTRDASPEVRKRLTEEFTGIGPLKPWLSQEDVTEILVQGTAGIWVERNGRLIDTETRFLGETTLNRVLHKILDESGAQVSQARPFANGRWGDFRVHVVTPPVTEMTTLSLRRRRETKWTLDLLLESGWAHSADVRFLRDCVKRRKHLMIVGPTSAGKTSVLEALLNELPDCERCILIEDTPELRLPNQVSSRLLTRQDPQDQLPEVTATELVRQALRMRPDRLLLGEIRGSEARDFLLATSAGHSGGLSTIHANNPHSALDRLEMLIQMSAPEWSTSTIRQVIKNSVDILVICGKSDNGARHLVSIHQVSSLEASGFTTEKIY